MKFIRILLLLFPLLCVGLNDIKSSNKYTINYMIDDAIWHYLTLEEGTKIPYLSPPKLEGYEFIGWSENVPEFMPANDLQVKALFSFVGYQSQQITEDRRLIRIQKDSYYYRAPYENDWDHSSLLVTKYSYLNDNSTQLKEILEYDCGFVLSYTFVGDNLIRINDNEGYTSRITFKITGDRISEIQGYTLYILKYDENNRLIEISYSYGEEGVNRVCWRIIWDEDINNIKRCEYYDKNSRLVAWVEYTYTPYVADQLSRYHWINPLSNDDFIFDFSEETCIFFNRFLRLSKNLPATMKCSYFKRSDDTEIESRILTYSYYFDFFGYPADVEIVGTDVGEFMNHRMILTIDWESFHNTDIVQYKPHDIQLQYQYYALDGIHLSIPKKGINIVKMKDGTPKKVLVK